MTEAALLLQLLRLPGVGPVRLRHILTRLAQVDVPLPDITRLSDDRLFLDLHLSPEQVQALRHPASDPEEDLHQCAELGIEILLFSDARYPQRIFSILAESAPPLLFTCGNLELLQCPALGISGSRRASERSLAEITHLCEAVASQGWVVVSGGARGTDEAAHLAAVRRGPGTIIVLPTGVLKPNIRKELMKHLEAGKALLLSEFLPEQGWTTGCAMQRNRILVALSRAVVLVEPDLRGGTGGTGRIAQALKTPLFILDSLKGENAASERFIREGAHLISAQSVTPQELTRSLQRSWEESEAARRESKPEALFPS